MHTRIALALGVGWALDSFEVQIINSVFGPIADEFGLSETQAVLVYVPWFAGILVGALVCGWLADRVGRRRLFVGTLLLYSAFAMLTALSWNFESLLFFRFATGLGVGGCPVGARAGGDRVRRLAGVDAGGLHRGGLLRHDGLGGRLPDVLRAVSHPPARHRRGRERRGRPRGRDHRDGRTRAHHIRLRAHHGLLLLAGFWAIGAVAAAIWLVRGVEARGVPLELLVEA